MFQIMIHLKRRLYKNDYSTFQHIVVGGGGCGGGGVILPTAYFLKVSRRRDLGLVSH